MTANAFGIHQSTVSNIILEVCIAVTKYPGPKYIHLRQNVEEMKQKVSQFEVKLIMIQAFGAIDGNHVPIHKTMGNLQDLFNYKVSF